MSEQLSTTKRDFATQVSDVSGGAFSNDAVSRAARGQPPLSNRVVSKAAQGATDPILGRVSGFPLSSYAGRTTLLARASDPIPLKLVADLGPLIRKSRKAMKFSQQQFADAAGVGRRFLSELENGKPSLEFDKVISCALAAGIDILAKPRLPL